MMIHNNTYYGYDCTSKDTSRNYIKIYTPYIHYEYDCISNDTNHNSIYHGYDDDTSHNYMRVYTPYIYYEYDLHLMIQVITT